MTVFSGVVDVQFVKLRERHPEAVLEHLTDGTSRVTVPNLPLGPMWSQPATSVHFVVPVGYPAAPPDCFWADPALTLLTGIAPANTAMTVPPWSSVPHLWFSYHVQQSWKPARDALVTYVRVIQERLKEGR